MQQGRFPQPWPAPPTTRGALFVCLPGRVEKQPAIPVRVSNTSHENCSSSFRESKLAGAGRRRDLSRWAASSKQALVGRLGGHKRLGGGWASKRPARGDRRPRWANSAKARARSRARLMTPPPRSVGPSRLMMCSFVSILYRKQCFLPFEEDVQVKTDLNCVSVEAEESVSCCGYYRT